MSGAVPLFAFPGHDFECVALRGVRLLLRVGVRPEERVRPQPVVIDVELYRRVDGTPPDSLAACLDYDRLHRHLLESWAEREHVELLEQLAAELAEFCLADARVELCRVILRKPEIYAGRGVPEVSLVRARPQRS